MSKVGTALVFLLCLLGTGCSESGPNPRNSAPANSDQAQLAVDFAQALANEDFLQAEVMLAPELELSSEQLKKQYQEMIGYGDGPADEVELQETLDDWALKKDDDILWAYVTLAGPEFLEGISVVISGDPYNPKIREIEWGRP